MYYINIHVFYTYVSVMLHAISILMDLYNLYSPKPYKYFFFNLKYIEQSDFFKVFYLMTFQQRQMFVFYFEAVHKTYKTQLRSTIFRY